MGFRYETHLHTVEVSACGKTKAKDYVAFYQKLGYDGIIITDHFFNGNCGVDRNLCWEERVDAFCRGYELAKEEGDRAGFSVFFGWEFNFHGDEYLTYGLDKAWLKAHPEIMQDSRESYYHRIREAGGAVVQAHPFRERGYLDAIRINPFFVDAVEVINSGNEPYQDAMAFEYAKRHQLPMTGGSDMHNAAVTASISGVETEQRIEDIGDFVRLIQSGKGFVPIVPHGRELVEEKSHVLPVFCYQKNGKFEQIRENRLHEF